MRKTVKTLKKSSLLCFVFLMLSLTAYGSDSSKHSSDGNGNSEYYSDGSLKSVGDTSKTGEKQNKWQYFYNNGIKMSEGEFLNGKESGKWTYWNKEGKLLATKDFGEAVEISTVKKGASHGAKTKTLPESKKSEPFVENRSGFAATMEEWKAMKKRKKEMPEVKAAVEVVVEEAPEPTPEPVHVPAPVVEQKVEISEPVHTVPVQEVVAQPVAEIAVPVEKVVEHVKEAAPVQKKKAVKSGGKFWKN